MAGGLNLKRWRRSEGRGWGVRGARALKRAMVSWRAEGAKRSGAPRAQRTPQPRPPDVKLTVPGSAARPPLFTDCKVLHISAHQTFGRFVMADNSLGLNGRTALITGAGGGLGRAHALLFAH